MEIINALCLFLFSYFLRSFHFYEIMIMYFILLFSISYLEIFKTGNNSYFTITKEYVYSYFPGQFLILIDITYNTIKFVNDIYVYGRDKTIYYVGKGISIIFIPKGFVNLAFLGMNPKKPNIINEDNNFEENVIEVNTVNEKKVFKSDRDMYKFLDELK